MSERTWLLRGGRIVDPARAVDLVGDLLIRDGRIAAVGEAQVQRGARVFDATGLVVAPGLIDVHVHLREPGFEEKETIASGTAAAAAGGFTTVFCMPNTRPALDSVKILSDLASRVRSDGRVRVHPIAAITLGRAGERAVDFHRLVEAGAVGFSDDGDTTENSAIMREALTASIRHGRPVMVHCEDKALADGAMHEGECSRRLGLPGIPAEAEEIVIARDLMLARLTGGWLHVCHVSTGRAAAMIRAAKAEGVRVTAEVTPHHLLMTDEWVAGDRTLVDFGEPSASWGDAPDGNAKVNPPLRPASEVRQLRAALVDGAIDVVATDHAPHASSEKVGVPFEAAAFGLSGLELALPLMLALVRAGRLSLSDVVAKLSSEPARLWRLPVGTLAVGATADVVVFDPDEPWTVSSATLSTKSANTPLLGMELRGKARLTLVGGEERYAG